MSYGEAELFVTLAQTVRDIFKDVTEILDAFPASSMKEIKRKIEELSEETELLKDNITIIHDLNLPNIHKVFGEQRAELKVSQKSLSKALKDSKKYNSEYNAAKLDTLSLQKQITKLEEQTVSLQQQLMEESNQNSNLIEQLQNERSMCTSFGATMACMLWRACRKSDVVSSVLTWYKFPEFLRMVTGTLESFTSTYITDDADTLFPNASTEEGHFVAGMLGIITNMLASSAGREILLIVEGQELLLSMVECLSQIPIEQGQYLRRLILMAFHNLMIDESGLQFLWNQEKFPTELMRNLHESDECRLISLRILAIYASSSSKFDRVPVLNNIDIKNLVTIANGIGEDGELAKKIIRCLKI